MSERICENGSVHHTVKSFTACTVCSRSLVGQQLRHCTQITCQGTTCIEGMLNAVSGCIWGSSSSSLVRLIVLFEIRWVEAFWSRFEPAEAEAEPLARVPNGRLENECTSQAIARLPDVARSQPMRAHCSKKETDPWFPWTKHAKDSKSPFLTLKPQGAEHHGRPATAMPPSASCHTSWLCCANRGTSCIEKTCCQVKPSWRTPFFVRFLFAYVSVSLSTALPHEAWSCSCDWCVWLCLLSTWH